MQYAEGRGSYLGSMMGDSEVVDDDHVALAPQMPVKRPLAAQMQADELAHVAVLLAVPVDDDRGRIEVDIEADAAGDRMRLDEWMHDAGLRARFHPRDRRPGCRRQPLVGISETRVERITVARWDDDVVDRHRGRLFDVRAIRVPITADVQVAVLLTIGHAENLGKFRDVSEARRARLKHISEEQSESDLSCGIQCPAAEEQKVALDERIPEKLHITSIGRAIEVIADDLRTQPAAQRTYSEVHSLAADNWLVLMPIPRKHNAGLTPG